LQTVVSLTFQLAAQTMTMILWLSLSGLNPIRNLNVLIYSLLETTLAVNIQDDFMELFFLDYVKQLELLTHFWVQ
jgi:hypothetical protein